MVQHKNITIDREVENEESIKLACLIRPDWSSENVQVKRFTDGITNRLIGCFLSHQPEDVILIRVYGEKTELFIDREKEKENMKLMYDAGLGPQLHFSFNNGLCYGYTPGSPATHETATDSVNSRSIAIEMAKMHSVISKLPLARKRFTNEPSLFRNLDKYIELLPSALSTIQSKWSSVASKLPSVEKISSEVTFLKEVVKSTDSPIVFCHNDLLLKNIICYDKPEQGVAFIDFEFADFNFQAFDIANHFCEFAGTDPYQPDLYPDEDFILSWLTHYVTAYFGVKDLSPNNETAKTIIDERLKKSNCNLESEEITVQVCKLVRQVTLFTLHAHFFWAVWSLLQAAHSSINFNFVGYALDRFAEYEKHKHNSIKSLGNRNPLLKISEMPKQIEISTESLQGKLSQSQSLFS